MVAPQQANLLNRYKQIGADIDDSLDRHKSDVEALTGLAISFKGRARSKYRSTKYHCFLYNFCDFCRRIYEENRDILSRDI